MAANDTAALVVALSAQVSKFEKDMKGAVAIADKHVKAIESRFTQMNGVIVGKLEQLGAAASSKLGFAGQILGALGPVGIAAAVGLGTAVGAMLALANATAEFAEKSKALKEGAETAGLTIRQFKLLGQAGQRVGLDFDETAAFFTKFIANMEALRDGSGPLYDALLKIDVGLLRQLSGTKDSAEAIDILVAAYKRLTDQTDRLNLSRAAGGRAGLSGGRLLESLGNQGGLAGLEAKGAPIDEAQTRRAAQLKVELDEIRRRTANIWGGMFSDDVLENEKKLAEDFLKIAQFIERIVGAKERSRALGSPGESQAGEIKAQKDDLEAQLQVIDAIKAANEEHRKALEGFGFTKKQIEDEIPALKGLEQQYESLQERLKAVEEQSRKTGAALPSASFAERFHFEAPPPPAPDKKATAAVDLSLFQRQIGLLGEAATQVEQLRLKRLELAAAAEKGGIADGIAERALAAFKLTMQAAALATRERLGVATEQQIVEAKLAQLAQDRAKFGLTDIEVQKATVVILREAKDAADALTVRQSYLPGLTQLVLDANNARKVMDQFAVSSVNSVVDGLADLVTGTKTASQAFRDMANAIIRDLARIAIRQAITAPLAGLFGGFFPARAWGGPVSAGMPYLVGERGPELFVPSNSGNIVPGSVTSRGSGGGISVFIQQSNSFSSGMTPTDMAVINNQLERTKSETINLTIDAIRRGQSNDSSFINRGG